MGTFFSIEDARGYCSRVAFCEQRAAKALNDGDGFVGISRAEPSCLSTETPFDMTADCLADQVNRVENLLTLGIGLNSSKQVGLEIRDYLDSPCSFVFGA